MKNHELINEEEWYRRCLEDGEYIVVSFDWSNGVTRVLDKETEKMFDVTSKVVGSKLMLEIKEVK